MDETTVNVGLLMEAAQAHQKLAETHLERLIQYMQDLDGVVRDEIRRTLVDELQELASESNRAVQALRHIKRSASVRSVLWAICLAALSTAVPAAIMHRALPSTAEIAALRAERDHLSTEISTLERQGGRVEWRHCGDPARLCVRIDRQAPVYGEHGDYYVLKGY